MSLPGDNPNPEGVPAPIPPGSTSAADKVKHRSKKKKPARKSPIHAPASDVKSESEADLKPAEPPKSDPKRSRSDRRRGRGRGGKRMTDRSGDHGREKGAGRGRGSAMGRGRGSRKAGRGRGKASEKGPSRSGSQGRRAAKKYSRPFRPFCRICEIKIGSSDENTKHLHSEEHKANEQTKYYCGVCQILIEKSDEVTHLSSESHGRVSSKWAYCYCCDKRFFAHNLEKHDFSKSHYEMMPNRSKREVINERCRACRFPFDRVFRTRGDWILHCLTDAHRSNVDRMRESEAQRYPRHHHHHHPHPPQPPPMHTRMDDGFFTPEATAAGSPRSAASPHGSGVYKKQCELCEGNPIFLTHENWRTHFKSKGHQKLHMERKEQRRKATVLKRKKKCWFCKSVHKTVGDWEAHSQSEEHLSKKASVEKAKEEERKTVEHSRLFLEFAELDEPKRMEEVKQKMERIRELDSDDLLSKYDIRTIMEYMRECWNMWQLFNFARSMSEDESMAEIEKICSSLAKSGFVEKWQFLDDSDKFDDANEEFDLFLRTMVVGQLSDFKSRFSYKVRKTAEDRAVQKNVRYSTKRHLRLIFLNKSDSPKRIVWKSEDGAMVDDLEVMRAMQRMIVGSKETVHYWPLNKKSVDMVEVSKSGTIVKYHRTLVDPEENTEQLRNSSIDDAEFEEKKEGGAVLRQIEDVISESDVRAKFREGLPSATIVSVRKLDSAENRARLHMFLVKSHLHTQEKVVFHGTKPETVPQISKNGFNRSFNTTYRWGQGTYFGSTSRVSYGYTSPDNEGNRFMFICIMGITHFQLGDRSIVRPPVLGDGVTQVDTLVNDITEPTILVAMKDGNAVPLWLIEFNNNDLVTF